MRSLLTSLAAAVVVLAGSAGTGHATITCAYNAGSKSLSITSDGANDSPQVGRLSGSTTIVVRSDNTTVVACSGAGTPTVTSVDTISYSDNAVAAQNSMTVDLSNGALAPGATSEPLCCSEIEMNFNMGTSADSIRVRGSDSAETIRVGTPGASEIDINLNASEAIVDQDVHVIQVSQFHADMGGGDDEVDLRGGAGTGAVLTATSGWQGGDGADTFFGGEGQHTLLAGAGDDTVHGGPGSDTVNPGPGDDVVDGGAGADSIALFGEVADLTIDLGISGPQPTGLGTDSYTGVESVYGGNGDDVLIGDGGPNGLHGYDGDDVIRGGAGDDYTEGGVGFDTVDFSDAPAGVTVKLGFNMQQQDTVGAGNDWVDSFESIRGSAFADTLTGDGSGNVLEGLAGADSLIALGGADTLLLRDGEGDTGDCGSGPDTAITDVAGVDTLTDCEVTQAAEPAPASGPGGAGNTGGTGGGGTGAVPDTTAPLLTRAVFRPRRFRAARGGRLRVVASEAAALELVIERCPRGRKCRRVRRLQGAVAAGSSTVKLRTKGLRNGRYRARIVATDAAGNRSAERRAAFRLRR